jgi:hypothetical protein
MRDKPKNDEAAPREHAIAVPLPKAPAILGISRSGLYRAAALGEIVLMKHGRATLVDMASARAYLLRLPTFKPKAGAEGGPSHELGFLQRPRRGR